MSRDVHSCTHWPRPPPRIWTRIRGRYWSATSLYDRVNHGSMSVRAFGPDTSHEGEIRQPGLMIHPELLVYFLCNSFRYRASVKRKNPHLLCRPHDTSGTVAELSYPASVKRKKSTFTMPASWYIRNCCRTSSVTASATVRLKRKRKKIRKESVLRILADPWPYTVYTCININFNWIQYCTVPIFGFKPPAWTFS